MVKIKLVDLVVEELTGKKDVAYDLPNGVSKLVVGRSHESDIQIFKDIPEDYRKAFGSREKVETFNKLLA